MFENLTYRQVPREEFQGRTQEYTKLLAETLFYTIPFTGTDLDRGAYNARVQKDARQPGFRAFFAESSAKVVGASTVTLFLDVAELERDAQDFCQINELAAFIRVQGFDRLPIVWKNWIFTIPAFQKLGVAPALSKFGFSEIQKEIPGDKLLLTAHHEQNWNIKKLSESFGFQRSGVKFVQETELEYWWKLA